VPGAGLDQVAAAKPVLPGKLWWNPRVTRRREVAVGGLPQEAGIAGRVIPAGDVRISDDRRLRLGVMLARLASFASTASLTPFAASAAASSLPSPTPTRAGFVPAGTLVASA